ncbi:MAG: GyrI-like domain-containing protein [Anaerolineaceae bacterium]|nr:GyrI-like domain-containing protein [Anaerolineaceae bacterium]
MIKIGEFAKLGCVSVKTLRHYARLNLLHPAHTDTYTGYRYYELTQLKRLNEILLFKLMGFSLENVNQLLTHRTTEQIDEMLTSQEIRLHEQQEEIRERLSWLQNSRNKLINARDALNSQVILKQQPAMELIILSGEAALSERRQYRQAILRMRQHLDSFLPAGQQIIDLPFWTIIECSSNENDSDMQCIEVGAPVTMNTIDTPLKQRSIPARENVLSVLYDPVQYPAEEARLALFEWTQRCAYHFDGPFVELHYQDSEKQLVELQRQVARSLPPQSIQTNYRRKIMDVTIKKRPAQLYIGQTRQFNKTTIPQIAVFWSEFFSNMAVIAPLLPPNAADGIPGNHSLGLCYPENEKGIFDYAVAFPLKENKVSDIPEGYEIIMVPEQEYVVIPAPGAKENIGKAYNYAFETWFPQQTEWEQECTKPDFELYDEHFNDFKEDSILWIYIPVRKK